MLYIFIFFVNFYVLLRPLFRMLMNFFLTFFLLSLLSFGQNQYPKDYFRSPLDIPLKLSGNFGELRSNHFHSGLDFKTDKQEGLNVYACAEGYISRIKISEVGYGKAVYITHPNGFTTVYCHLQSGFGLIEKFIKNEQYKAKSYELDILLKPQDLTVAKGDVIGFSGNTGSSDGPHLHFEFRDTQTEKIINPLFFGFDAAITDTKRPIINSVWVYPLDANTIVNESKRPIAVNLSLQDDGSYLAEKILASGAIGFGVTTFDYDDVSWNANGVFKVQTFLNGRHDFSCQFDTFDFNETRQINALIDYERYKALGQRVQKLFLDNPYSLSIINPGERSGVIKVENNITQLYRIEVSDFNQNTVKIHVPIQYAVIPSKISAVPITSKYFVKSKKENIFSLENVTVSFPPNTFYNDFYMNFEIKGKSLFLHKDIVPAFTNFYITFEDSIVPIKDREKMFIGLVIDKKVKYFNTKTYKNSFSIYSKILGEYKLFKDGTPPKIKPEKRIGGKWINDLNALTFFISDELSGIKSYNGYLNGKWILFEYESKTKKIVYHFSDGVVDEGRNDLKVVITDNVGNSSIFETHFFRSQKP